MHNRPKSQRNSQRWEIDGKSIPLVSQDEPLPFVLFEICYSFLVVNGAHIKRSMCDSHIGHTFLNIIIIPRNTFNWGAVFCTRIRRIARTMTVICALRMTNDGWRRGASAEFGFASDLARRRATTAPRRFSFSPWPRLIWFSLRIPTRFSPSPGIENLG